MSKGEDWNEVNSIFKFVLIERSGKSSTIKHSTDATGIELEIPYNPDNLFIFLFINDIMRHTLGNVPTKCPNCDMCKNKSGQMFITWDQFMELK